MLEAMLAMGLLAVASAAGGIATILIAEHMVDEANGIMEEEEDEE